VPAKENELNNKRKKNIKLIVIFLVVFVLIFVGVYFGGSYNKIKNLLAKSKQVNYMNTN